MFLTALPENGFEIVLRECGFLTRFSLLVTRADLRGTFYGFFVKFAQFFICISSAIIDHFIDSHSSGSRERMGKDEVSALLQSVWVTSGCFFSRKSI